MRMYLEKEHVHKQRNAIKTKAEKATVTGVSKADQDPAVLS